MSAVELQNPILDGGIRSVNFFNGRLLTARDLSREQEAHREAVNRIGQAAGDGVAYGLEVTKSGDYKKESPAITVEPGLAVNRQGLALRLASKTEILLVRQVNAGSDVPKGFSQCAPIQFGASLSGDGLFLLTLAPAIKNEGRASVSGLEAATATCNTDAVVSAVQFRLIQLPNSLLNEVQDLAKLRNHLAYRSFGARELNEFDSDPLDVSAATYGLLDSLRENPLTDCDVPLAVLHWTIADGIKFIDLWSVRRRLTRRGTFSHWDPAVSDRRQSEAEAAFLQFQDQLDWILRNETAILPSLQADQRFRFLPPVGYLPAVPGGLDWTVFLGPLIARHVAVDEGILRATLQRSLAMEPIKVGSFGEGTEAKKSPPVPVDIYYVPDRGDFVMFARSSNSRIRVFLKPPPISTGQLAIQASTPNSSETRYAVGVKNRPWYELQGLAPDQYALEVALSGFQKPAPAFIDAVGGRTMDIEVPLVPLARGSILLSVKDNKKQTDINDKVISVTGKSSDGKTVAGVRSESGSWQISDLLPDTYDINVVATGYVPGSAADIQVTANQVATFTLALDPKEVVPDKPAECVITVSQINRRPFKIQLCMMLQSISFNTPIPPELIEVQLDEQGKKWLSGWQDWLAKQYEKQNIEFSTPRVLLNPSSVLGGGGGGGPKILHIDRAVLDRAAIKTRAFEVQERIKGPITIKGLKTTTGTFEFIPIDAVKAPPPPAGLAIFGKAVIPLTVKPLD
jgi:hypothetical protein